MLDEARDPSTPLLERLKFAAIAASNLDEFFMVRVAAVRHDNETGETGFDMAGLSASEQFTVVATAVMRWSTTSTTSQVGCCAGARRLNRFSCCRGPDLGPFRLGLSAYFGTRSFRS